MVAGGADATRPEPRAAVLVDDVIGAASLRGERLVATVRAFICGAGALLWPFAAKDLRALAPTAVLAEVLLAAALLVSVVSLWRLRRARMTRWQLRASAATDAILVLLAFFGFVWWPPADYTGVVHVAGIGWAYLAIVAAGVRLSRSIALLSLTIFTWV